MAKWLGQETRVPVVIVELLEEEAWRRVRPEIRQAHSVEPAAPYLAAEKQLARATLQRALSVLAASRSVRRARVFFAPGWQP